jgi:hypothetical protein
MLSIFPHFSSPSTSVFESINKGNFIFPKKLSISDRDKPYFLIQKNSSDIFNQYEKTVITNKDAMKNIATEPVVDNIVFSL